MLHFDQLEIQTERRTQSHIAIVRCIGQINSMTCQQFEDELQDVLASGYSRLIIDFSGVSYISAPGIGIILNALSKVEVLRGKIVFLRPNGNVRAVFDLIGLSDVLSIAPDMPSALWSLWVEHPRVDANKEAHYNRISNGEGLPRTKSKSDSRRNEAVQGV